MLLVELSRRLRYMPEKGGLKADKILHILPKTTILSMLWSEGFQIDALTVRGEWIGLDMV